MRFCWSSDEIHLFKIAPDGAHASVLDLTRLLSDQVAVLEPPATYALADLIARAKKRNFSSVVAFQKVAGAQDAALNAEWNLLPHANTGDLLNILSDNVITGLKSAGNLVPFLFPSNWFRAAGASDLLASEKDAWELMDLDGVKVVKCTAYGIIRDEKVLDSIAVERLMISELRDLLRGKEQSGLVRIGVSDDLTALINKIDLSITGLRTFHDSELATLSQAAGFYNPKAITGVSFSPDPNAPSAAQPLPIDFNAAAGLAVSRSIELRQMSELVAWARNQRNARLFDWMLPSGDPSGGVGLGLPSYIEAGQDQVNLIRAESDDVKSILLRDLSETIDELNKAAGDFSLSVQGELTNKRRVDRIAENLRIGMSFVMSDLVSAFQDEMNSQIAEIDAEYGYLIALSDFNRILYQSSYAQENGDSSWSASP